ncbi:TolC family protein [Ectothiorhodosinus mongolicus]|nr:TolC family protein [Ectothiorhodosinus mongolicus]
MRQLRDKAMRTAAHLGLALGLTLAMGIAPSLSDEWGQTPSVSSLALSVEDAVFMALERNRALAVEMLQPQITGTFAAIERAAFDPVIFGELRVGETEELRQFDQAALEQTFVRSERDELQLGLRQTLPTGTELELVFRTQRSDSSLPRIDEQFSARGGLSLTQALLQGAGLGTNLARLRQARLDTEASEYEFRGFVENLVADVEATYWDYVLASERVRIFEQALEVASQQLTETRQRIAVGQRPETEETSALAEEALRLQGLINARAERARARMRLLQLVNATDMGWETPITPLDEAQGELPSIEPVDAYLALAAELRPALNEARLRVARGDLEVVRTRNGLLPRLDLFITLGQSGYADSFSQAWRETDGPGYDYSVGLRLEVPIGNRAARAEASRARLSREQAQEALGNLEQLSALDVQQAWLEAQRTREQIRATRLTRELQAEVLRTEQVRFRVGSGTALAVSRAERDLLESQLDEVEAVIRYRQAVIELYRQSGSLLLHRGIDAPGPIGFDS